MDAHSVHTVANAISDRPNIDFYSSSSGCNAIDGQNSVKTVLNLTLSVCMWTPLTPFLCLATQQAVFLWERVRACVCWMDYLGRETQRSNWHQLHQMFLVAHRCEDRLWKIESRCRGSTANSSLTTIERLLPRMSVFCWRHGLLQDLESGLWPRLEKSISDFLMCCWFITNINLMCWQLSLFWYTSLSLKTKSLII